MKDNISIIVAVVAIVISTIAVTTVFVRTPDTAIGAGTITGNELDDESVSTESIMDGTIIDEDIADSGISKIADSSVTLSDLTTEVLAEMSGIVEILDNSILGSKLANNSILNRHVNDNASIDPVKIQGVAWTKLNDGTGSGLDADTIDSIDSLKFVRNDLVTTRYYSIHASGFRSNDYGIAYDRASVGAVLRNSDPAFAPQSYLAPVILPQGATITKITVRYRTTDPAAVGSIHLYKHGDDPVEIYSTSIPYYSGGSTNHEVPLSETINNNNQAYYLRVELDPVDEDEDIWLEWVCITYTVTSPFP